jgi:amidophosphoribosyltransferase
MCGIVGMISNGQSVVRKTATSLAALENRGRHSTGLYSASNGKRTFDMKFRRPGSASTVFEGMDLESIASEAAIGHVRYATSGDSLEQDAQPLRNPKPFMAISHNGQIANYLSLQERLVKEKGFGFATNCDVEALLFAFAQNMIDIKISDPETTEGFFNEKIVPALKATMDESLGGYFAIGAYSTVVLIPGKGLLAFKDPNGIRPLCYAVREKEGDIIHAFASESIALPVWAHYGDAEELKPGEAIFIDYGLNVYREIVHDLGEKVCPLEAAYFSKGHSMFNGRDIESIRARLGLALASEYMDLADRVDCIVPVPKTPIPAALALAGAWNKPYGGVEANQSIRTFQGNSQSQREIAAVNKFSFNKQKIYGKRVGVVDDSVVRGTNSRSIIDALYRLGAKEVHFLSTYPEFINICPGGVDVASEKELLLRDNSPEAREAARQQIHATTLNYLSLDSMLSSMGLRKDQICGGCIIKEHYPFDMTDYRRYQKVIEQQRSCGRE